ncbi:MAG: histidinol-phosphate transaminase [Spirochaetaceae bacterium]
MRPRQALSAIAEYVPGMKKKDAVKLSSNENPFGPSPMALSAIEKWAPSVNVYPDSEAGELKAALAGHLGVAPERLIVGNGSDEVLFIAAATFLNPAERAVIPEHTFSQYEFATRLYDGRPAFAPMREGQIQLSAMGELIDGNTRLVFVCNPNNPTGTYLSEAELFAFAETVPEDVLLVIDEAYREFADADDFPDSLRLAKERDNVLVLRTFSKLYGLASLRIGYGVGSESLIRTMHTAKPPFNTGILPQKAATAALSDTEFVRRTLENNREQREVLRIELDQLGMPQYPSEANFICTDCGRDAAAFAADLGEEGVSVRPLGSFGMPTWLRITVGTPEQNRLLVEALVRVRERDAREGVARS